MKDKFIDFVSCGIYNFEFLTSSNNENKKYIKVSLSKDNFTNFCTYMKNRLTTMEMDITIYDEGILTNSHFKKARENLIRILNNLNIRKINFELSDSTIAEYNRLMKIVEWKHKEKTIINIKIDRNPISEEIRDWNLCNTQGILNINEEKLIWLSDYQLEQLHGIVDEQILKNTIALKKLIIFVDQYLKQKYKIEQLNDFDKVYLIYKFVKTQIIFPRKYIKMINEKKSLKSNYKTQIPDPYGKFINKEELYEVQARIMNILLNNPIMKINSTIIEGESPHGRQIWVGFVLNNKLYSCCSAVQEPFNNLNGLGHRIYEPINNKQIYPTLYEQAYLSEQEIKKIERKTKKLIR